MEGAMPWKSDEKQGNTRSLSDEGFGNKERDSNLDSGWAWLVCFGAFCILFLTFGQHNCAGIIFSGILDEFQKGRGETAWVLSLSSSTKHTFGPFAAFLSERYGCRVVAIIGGTFCVVGLLSSSFCTSLHPLYVTYGVIWGLGTCLSYCSSIIIVSRYFRKRLALANGIVAMGSAVGGLVLSPLLQLLLKVLGIKKTLRFLSGLQVMVVLSGLLYRPKSCHPGSNGDKTLQTRKLYDWSVFKNKEYIVWVLSMVVFMPAYLVTYVHLIRLAEDRGSTKLNAAFLVIFIGVGGIVGRPFFGAISDSRVLNRYYIMPLGQLGLAVTLTLLPISGYYPWLACCAFVFGFFEGCFMTLLPVITSDIVGSSKFSCALGSMFFLLSFPEAAGSPIAGWMYDSWKSYTVAFMIAGGLTVLSICIMLFVPFSVSSEHRGIVDREDSIKKPLNSLEEKCCRTSNLMVDSLAVVRETVL